MSLYDNPGLADAPASVLSWLETLASNLAGTLDEQLLVEIVVDGVLAGKKPAEFLQAVLDRLDDLLKTAPVWEKRAASLFLKWSIAHLGA